MKSSHNQLNRNEKGIVSIVVTLIIMILLTLIVIGFARITRREQRQALDQQLSTQAYYAAEAGVSDAVHVIKEEFNDNTATPLVFEGSGAKNYTRDCNEFIADADLESKKTIETPSGPVSYTCLLVDPDPLSLEYGNVDTNESSIVPVFSKDGGAIHSISIAWQDKDGGQEISGCGADTNTPPRLPAFADWNTSNSCNTGMMRVDLVPVAGTDLTRDSLLDSNATVFLYPWPNGTTGATNEISYASSGPNTFAQPGFGKQGNIVRVNCGPSAAAGSSKQCHLTISGLAGLGSDAFMLRLRSIYRPSAVTVKATRGAGTELELRSAQAMIDSTGKSNDVLRRIQVRVPIAATDLSYPEAALQTTDSLCKRFAIAPGTPVVWDGRDRCNLLEPSPYPTP